MNKKPTTLHELAKKNRYPISHMGDSKKKLVKIDLEDRIIYEDIKGNVVKVEMK